MSVVIQDALVTVVASAAAVVLLWRVKEAVWPRRRTSGCATCSGCDGSRAHPPAEPSR